MKINNVSDFRTHTEATLFSGVDIGERRYASLKRACARQLLRQLLFRSVFQERHQITLAVAYICATKYAGEKVPEAECRNAQNDNKSHESHFPGPCG